MIIFAVASTGPPFCGVAVVAVDRELNEAEEPAKAVEPESWLARGAWFILVCEKPLNPLEFG